MRTSSLLFLGASFVLIACSSEDSSGLATNQLRADYSVTVDTFGKGSFRAEANFEKEGDTFTSVRLDGTDTITVTTDKDPSLALAYDSTAQLYSTSLDGGGDRTTASFVLARAQGTSTSKIPLPSVLTLTTPAPMASVPYGDGTGNVDFTWSNSLSGAKVTVQGFPSCDDNAISLTTSSANGPDTGTISVPMSTLLVGAPTAGGQCITVRLTRQVTGTPDSQIAGDSSIDAERMDYVKIVIMP